MELRQLRYFSEVAQTGSITEASRRLFITQAALSNSIKSLETELGAPLFDREKNRISLNPNGRHFLGQVNAALATLNAAKKGASAYQDERDRTVYCEYGVPLGDLGKLVKQFSSEHPDIVLKVLPRGATMRERENESTDAVIYASFAPQNKPSHLLLFMEDVFVVAPPGHRLAKRPFIQFTDLKGEPLILGDVSELNNWVWEQCGNHGFEPKTTMYAYHWTDMLSLVEEGLGCSFAGSFTWLSGLRHDIVPKRIAGAAARRGVYARIPTANPPSKATYVFLDFVSKYAREVNARA